MILQLEPYSFLFKVMPYTVAILVIILIFLWRHLLEYQKFVRKERQKKEAQIYSLSEKAIKVSLNYRSDAKRESEEHKIIIKKLDTLIQK